MATWTVPMRTVIVKQIIANGQDFIVFGIGSQIGSAGTKLPIQDAPLVVFCPARVKLLLE
jgi:hypothetical protein